jgi:hypothetical protein
MTCQSVNESARAHFLLSRLFARGPLTRPLSHRGRMGPTGLKVGPVVLDGLTLNVKLPPSWDGRCQRSAAAGRRPIPALMCRSWSPRPGQRPP